MELPPWFRFRVMGQAGREFIGRDRSGTDNLLKSDRKFGVLGVSRLQLVIEDSSNFFVGPVEFPRGKIIPHSHSEWWRRGDSNARPRDYETHTSDFDAASNRLNDFAFEEDTLP